MLQNEYFLGDIGFNTAENEPSKNWQRFSKRWQILQQKLQDLLQDFLPRFVANKSEARRPSRYARVAQARQAARGEGASIRRERPQPVPPRQLRRRHRGPQQGCPFRCLVVLRRAGRRLAGRPSGPCAL